MRSNCFCGGVFMNFNIDLDNSVKLKHPGKNEFRCQFCKEIYEKAWSDECAEAEYQENFNENEMAQGKIVVCDDCYKTFMMLMRFL